jgi:uncharacterized protein YkwD
MRRLVLRDPSVFERVDAAMLARELETILNGYRLARGLASLRPHAVLGAAARQHSARMRNLDFFDHRDHYDFTLPHQRVVVIDPGPWRIVAENLAAGAPTAHEILDGWIDSPGHRANLEHPDLTHVGTDIALGGTMRVYATQVYGADWASGVWGVPALAAACARIASDGRTLIRRRAASWAAA